MGLRRLFTTGPFELLCVHGVAVNTAVYRPLLGVIKLDTAVERVKLELCKFTKI